MGGSLSNGTLILDNTLILPFGMNISEFILCTIKGSCKEGQLIYKAGKILFYYNGQWYDITSVASIDGISGSVAEILK
jgi:hypothetical protein